MIEERRNDKGIDCRIQRGGYDLVYEPVALVVDVLALPFDAESNKDAFTRTAKMLDSAGKNITKAVDTE